MKIIEAPQGWFAWALVGTWGLLLVGTLLVFIFPKYLAATLIKPLWILSIVVVLGTWVWGVIRAVRLFRRWFRTLRESSK
jgi:hypothetical protein